MCQVTTAELLAIQRILSEQDTPDIEPIVCWVDADGSCYMSPIGVIVEDPEDEE